MIRAYTPTDREAVERLIRENFGDGASTSPLDPLDDGAPLFVGFVEDSGSTPGSGIAEVVTWSPAAELRLLATEPSARQRGTGTAILTALERAVERLGAESLLVELPAGDLLARRFFSNRGYNLEGEISDASAQLMGLTAVASYSKRLFAHT